ncbi:hypothetical protein HDR67_01215, partial [bacterium]|nr:hypothetical protein [bacterium]
MKKRFGFFLIWSIVCLALVSCGKNPVDKDDTEEGEEVKPPSLVETTNTLVAY